MTEGGGKLQREKTFCLVWERKDHGKKGGKI